MNITLKKGIDWVGYIDWTVRDFHGYKTENGSTYNAFLIKDKKCAIIDGVKAQYADSHLKHIRARTKLENINYIVCNHAEPDHSGDLPKIVKACPNAEMVCNAKCQKTLEKQYDTTNWKWKIINDGDTISLGEKTLSFINTPMVHWPESMFTYIPEDKVLFSMDAFGQHYASPFRFDDEEPLSTIIEGAKAYYANIVMLYGRPISETMQRVKNLEIDIIAPSHGMIWRNHIKEIVSCYQDWVKCKQTPKVIVIYASMWNNTELMARAILEGAQEYGVKAQLYDVDKTHRTKIVTDILDAAAIAVGSPTLNNSLMPEMAAVLTYLQGLRPSGKSGFAFGSYGWSKRGGAGAVENYLKEMKVELLSDPIRAKYRPTPEELEICREAGRKLGKHAEQYNEKNF